MYISTHRIYFKLHEEEANSSENFNQFHCENMQALIEFARRERISR